MFDFQDNQKLDIQQPDDTQAQGAFGETRDAAPPTKRSQEQQLGDFVGSSGNEEKVRVIFVHDSSVAMNLVLKDGSVVLVDVVLPTYEQPEPRTIEIEILDEDFTIRQSWSPSAPNTMQVEIKDGQYTIILKDFDSHGNNLLLTMLFKGDILLVELVSNSTVQLEIKVQPYYNAESPVPTIPSPLEDSGVMSGRSDYESNEDIGFEVNLGPITLTKLNFQNAAHLAILGIVILATVAVYIVRTSRNLRQYSIDSEAIKKARTTFGSRIKRLSPDEEERWPTERRSGCITLVLWYLNILPEPGWYSRNLAGTRTEVKLFLEEFEEQISPELRESVLGLSEIVSSESPTPNEIISAYQCLEDIAAELERSYQRHPLYSVLSQIPWRWLLD